MRVCSCQEAPPPRVFTWGEMRAAQKEARAIQTRHFAPGEYTRGYPANAQASAKRGAAGLRATSLRAEVEFLAGREEQGRVDPGGQLLRTVGKER